MDNASSGLSWGATLRIVGATTVDHGASRARRQLQGARAHCNSCVRGRLPKALDRHDGLAVCAIGLECEITRQRLREKFVTMRTILSDCGFRVQVPWGIGVVSWGGGVFAARACCPAKRQREAARGAKLFASHGAASRTAVMLHCTQLLPNMSACAWN